MAPSIQLAFFIITILLTSFCFSRATAVDGNPPASTPSVTDDLNESMFSPITLFEPILTNLGFEELAMEVRSLSSDSVFTTAWNGPFTLFAPTDASIRSCLTSSTCSITRLLRQHFAPGLFSHDYLLTLASGRKIDTMDLGHCITVTSDANNNSKIYVNGVEITRPDLFNNGIIVVHGLHRYIALLSPVSCNNNQQSASIMRLMLHDAMLRLSNYGYSVLSNALYFKYAELVKLQNMTVFAVDDVSIYSGGRSDSYVSKIRFHIVPNHLLTISDLENLPVGTSLPTLATGQSLAITTAAEILPMRINYVQIKIPDVISNLKIVVHSVYSPFPYLHHSVFASASTKISPNKINGGDATYTESCAANPTDQDGDCATGVESSPSAAVGA